MIRFVTFDFWGTLVADSPDNLRAQRALRIEALARALAAAGSPLAGEEVEAAYDRSQAVLVDRFWSRHRDLGSREQVRVVLSELTGALSGCAIGGYRVTSETGWSSGRFAQRSGRSRISRPKASSSRTSRPS